MQIGNTPSNPRQDGPTILSLPKKILTQIIEQIGCPRQQVLFSLTCSAALLAAEPVTKKPCTIHPSRACGKMQLLQDLRSWVPADLQLCRQCMKYVPKHKIWTTPDGTPLMKLPGKIDWMWMIREWVYTGRACPKCQFKMLESDGANMREDWIQCWGEGMAMWTLVVQKY